MKRVWAIVAAWMAVGGLAWATNEFKWSWQGEEKTISEETAPPAQTAQAPKAETPAAAPAHGVDPAAYAKLLQENQELRRKIAGAEKEKESIEQANARLSTEISGLEQRITLMAARVDQLNKEKTTSSGDADKVAGLETRVTEAEKEKARLTEELARLRSTEREAKIGGDRPKEDSGKRAEPEPAGAAVKPGSDLYRQKEQENAALREKLAQAQDERQKPVKARDAILKKGADADQKARQATDEQKNLERKLAEYKSAEKEHKELIGKLMKQIPPMEKEITDLRSTVAKKKAATSATEEEVETLRLELEKREHRLNKAERMAVLLEQAHEKVKQAGDDEKRNMHYNMAAVYAKEGRNEDAEREYLNALKIDPNDADVHFNLGILYEEGFNDKGRAIRHYKKYLKLNPYAPDADKVRGWLAQLEIE